MVDELKRIVRDATDEEVKSLLFHTLMRINLLEESDQYTEKQFTADLISTYNRFLDYKRQKGDKDASFQIAHILFGDSAAGSLKMALKEMKMENREQVITFSDLFSIAPIQHLHTEQGIEERFKWIKNHLIFDEEIEVYAQTFIQTIHQINRIPQGMPIMIWAGQNSHEQTALRYVIYLLRDRINQITLIDSTKQYKEQFRVPHSDNFPLHTGEIASEKLQIIYDSPRMPWPLSMEQRKQLEKEWIELSARPEVLRIWEHNTINSVEAAYYDRYIIKQAKKLHREQKSPDFLLSARLIGEIIGHLDQYIGDEYFEYRIRELIMKGIFEIKGVPKAMRFYSVKLN